MSILTEEDADDTGPEGDSREFIVQNRSTGEILTRIICGLTR